MDLVEIRKEIDQIDADLIALLRSFLVFATRILFLADLMLANSYTSKHF